MKPLSTLLILLALTTGASTAHGDDALKQVDALLTLIALKGPEDARAATPTKTRCAIPGARAMRSGSSQRTVRAVLLETARQGDPNAHLMLARMAIHAPDTQGVIDAYAHLSAYVAATQGSAAFEAGLLRIEHEMTQTQAEQARRAAERWKALVTVSPDPCRAAAT